jgi:predicted metal-dependent phosphoesterase TrpH
MQLFIDLHSHSRFSADGVAEPEAMVAEARAKGLHGFAITDHNTCACVDYFEQHGLLNKEGLPVNGLLIIPGQEITTAEGHLLALGVRLPDL